MELSDEILNSLETCIFFEYINIHFKEDFLKNEKYRRVFAQKINEQFNHVWLTDDLNRYKSRDSRTNEKEKYFFSTKLPDALNKMNMAIELMKKYPLEEYNEVGIEKKYDRTIKDIKKDIVEYIEKRIATYSWESCTDYVFNPVNMQEIIRYVYPGADEQIYIIDFFFKTLLKTNNYNDYLNYNINDLGPQSKFMQFLKEIMSVDLFNNFIFNLIICFIHRKFKDKLEYDQTLYYLELNKLVSGEYLFVRLSEKQREIFMDLMKRYSTENTQSKDNYDDWIDSQIEFLKQNIVNTLITKKVNLDVEIILFSLLK